VKGKKRLAVGKKKLWGKTQPRREKQEGHEEGE